jgi:peptidoglycan/xylan/chitin deacetylase (PgdA/CDA1 family)
MIGRKQLESVLAVWARTRGTPGAILCYHGIGKAQPHDPLGTGLHVPQTEFRDTLKLLRTCADIVPLSEILRRRERGASTKGLVALTFDDAYQSLLSPGLLGQNGGLPITIFVAPELLGTHPWWDRLDEVFERCSHDAWIALETALGVTTEDRGPDKMRYGPIGPLRHRLITAHAGRWPRWAEPHLAQLEAAVVIPRHQTIMSWAELEEFAGRDGVDVGVHTMTHPALPFLADDEILSEIRGSHDVLRQRLGNVAPVLAAPFGLHDPRVLRGAAEAGMSATLTLEGRTLKNRGSLHGTSRICMMGGEPLPRQRLRLAGMFELLPLRA